MSHNEAHRQQLLDPCNTIDYRFKKINAQQNTNKVKTNKFGRCLKFFLHKKRLIKNINLYKPFLKNETKITF